jgi:hypothetical protein
MHAAAAAEFTTYIRLKLVYTATGSMHCRVVEAIAHMGCKGPERGASGRIYTFA